MAVDDLPSFSHLRIWGLWKQWSFRGSAAHSVCFTAAGTQQDGCTDKEEADQLTRQKLDNLEGSWPSVTVTASLAHVGSQGNWWSLLISSSLQMRHFLNSYTSWAVLWNPAEPCAELLLFLPLSCERHPMGRETQKPSAVFSGDLTRCWRLFPSNHFCNMGFKFSYWINDRPTNRYACGPCQKDLEHSRQWAKKEKSIFFNDNMTQLIQLPRQCGFPEFSSLPIFQLPSCCLVLCLLGQTLFFHLEINFEDSIQSSELHYGIFTI